MNSRANHEFRWRSQNLSLGFFQQQNSRFSLEVLTCDNIYFALYIILSCGFKALYYWTKRTLATLSCPSNNFVGLVVETRFNKWFRSCVVNYPSICWLSVSKFSPVFFQCKSWSLFNVFIDSNHVLRGLWCFESWSPCCCSRTEGSYACSLPLDSDVERGIGTQ